MISILLLLCAKCNRRNQICHWWLTRHKATQTKISQGVAVYRHALYPFTNFRAVLCFRVANKGKLAKPKQPPTKNAGACSGENAVGRERLALAPRSPTAPHFGGFGLPCGLGHV